MRTFELVTQIKKSTRTRQRFQAILYVFSINRGKQEKRLTAGHTRA